MCYAFMLLALKKMYTCLFKYFHFYDFNKTIITTLLEINLTTFQEVK